MGRLVLVATVTNGVGASVDDAMGDTVGSAVEDAVGDVVDTVVGDVVGDIAVVSFAPVGAELGDGVDVLTVGEDVVGETVGEAVRGELVGSGVPVRVVDDGVGVGGAVRSRSCPVADPICSEAGRVHVTQQSCSKMGTILGHCSGSNANMDCCN